MLFRTIRGMQDQYAANVTAAGLPLGKYRDTRGGCTFWTPQPGKRVGCIVLPLDYIGAGIVSHELTHAALYWISRRTALRAIAYEDRHRLDERLANTQGWLVTQFWRHWYRTDAGA